MHVVKVQIAPTLNAHDTKEKLLRNLRRVPAYVKIIVGHILSTILMILLIANWGQHQSKNYKLDQLEKELVAVKQMSEEIKSLAFGPKADISKIKAITVKVTSYNPLPSQGWGNGKITASGSLAAPGMLAVSRDLMKRYNLKFGQRVMLKNYGAFTVKDLMHPRKRNQVDIISFIPGWSKSFGTKTGTLYIVPIKS